MVRRKSSGSVCVWGGAHIGKAYDEWGGVGVGVFPKYPPNAWGK